MNRSERSPARRRWTAALAVLAAALAVPTASAQSAWPNRTIRMVVPFPPGGGADVLARTLSEALSKRLGQPIIVENRPGVGGNLGTDAVAKAAPDGYTLLMTPPAPIAQAVALYRKLPYDPRTDLVMISDVAQARLACAVNPQVPASTFPELLAWAKANPGKLTIGSWGPGTHPHMVQAMLDRTFGTQTVHVPYKGEAPMVSDLIGGQIAMSCSAVTTLKPHLEAGRLRALATIGPNRAALLPDLPAFAEIGYPQEVLKLTGPVTLLAPARTPVEVIERVGREAAAFVRSPEMTRQIETMGMEPIGNLPAEAAAGYAARLPVLTGAIRDTGTTLD
ncbi:MAG TPA: tripartite tricarboxylate transporter substrate binding protein [Burkholderiaceae bacterium]|nr:tripartite tricarboxylate transporter substrate binding protein [Burkholderiaceae bacterium]